MKMYRHYSVIPFIHRRAALRRFIDKFFFYIKYIEIEQIRAKLKGFSFLITESCIARNAEIYCKIASTNLPYLLLFTINKHRS